MKIRIILISLALFNLSILRAQEKPQQWDLTNCINYALQNNIQIQKSKISKEQSGIDLKLAKAQLFPNLSATVGQNVSNNPFNSTTNYTGSYSISSSMTLFDGGKTLKNIEQQKLAEQVGNLAVLEAGKNIQMSILQSYLQILYASESIKTNKATVEVSEYQLQRAQQLLQAGSISRADLAQLESQLSSDKYQMVVSENSLRTYKLQLKQLLELSANEEININIPELNSLDVLKSLPSLSSIYETALNTMPQMKSSQIEVQIAGLETEKARTAYLPKVSLNANIGSSNGSGTGFSEQIKNNWGNVVGVSVSIPVFTKRENKSAVEKARLSEKTSQLELQNTEKELLKEIESVFQEALSAQSQYVAALEKEKALKTSYELIEQQFNLGMKNTLELLTEKNNLLAAQQNLVQSKYMSLLNAQLLNLYQDLPLEIK